MEYENNHSDTPVPCSLCGSKKTQMINTKVRYAKESSCHAYHCKSCKVDFIYPVLDDDLEGYYDGQFRSEIKRDQNPYTDLDKEFSEYLEEAKVRLNRIKSQLSKQDEILEIGAYTGYFLHCISDYVAFAYGTDWDSRARQYVSKRFEGKNIEMSKNPEDFDRKFDKIFLFHVLEHIKDPVKYLLYLKDFLKPDAKLYIEVPNVDDALMTKYDCQEFKEHFYSKVHLFNYSETSLRYIFKMCGFKNVKIDFIQRYDISYHLFWLRYRKPGGYGYYDDLFNDKLNKEYAKALIKSKQSDAIMATISLGESIK